jgi:hypothetical protein
MLLLAVVVFNNVTTHILFTFFYNNLEHQAAAFLSNLGVIATDLARDLTD